MNEWLQQSVLFMPNWKWAGMVLAFFSGWLLRSVAFQAVLYFKQRKKLRANAHRMLQLWLDLPVHKSISWIICGFFWLLALKSLSLPEGLNNLGEYLVKFILAVMLIRLSYISVDAFGSWLGELAAKTESTLDDQIAPFAAKTLKVTVIILGALIALQNFGVNVMSLLAGLGLGGLALALAAQDTAANLFGSITILADRPFQIGDFVKIGATEGLIEEIGFRSTRIRTFYNSLVTIPNSTVAKEMIDNLGARPARRLRHTFGFVYGTPIETIQAFQDRLRYFLIQTPKVRKEDVTVTFNCMGDFSLQVLMNIHVFAVDVTEENALQQEILFEVMRIAKSLKAEFAFPTHSVYLQPPPT